jgi:hypothetical protein
MGKRKEIGASAGVSAGGAGSALFSMTINQREEKRIKHEAQASVSAAVKQAAQRALEMPLVWIHSLARRASFIASTCIMLLNGRVLVSFNCSGWSILAKSDLPCPRAMGFTTT